MFKLDDSLGFLVNRAALAMRWALDDRLAKHDLTAPQWAILARLWEEDGQPLSAVGQAMHFDKPTTTGIVDRLEKKKLARRVRDSADRRVIRVYLTAAGKRLRSKLPSLARQVNTIAAKDMSKRELAALKEYLQRIWHNLD